MIRKTAFIGLLIISITFITGIVRGAPDWHKPLPCWGCHGETFQAEYGNQNECGNCHDYGLDESKLQAEHNPKICTLCHSGNTIVNGSEKENFHNGHNAINCSRCHSDENFTVMKTQNKDFQCASCHGSLVHNIHIKNLAKMCPLCHGSWAAGKVYKNGAEASTNKVDEDSKFEKFTIFTLIKNMFNVLLGIR